jgi:hypothetical protein
MVKIWKETIKGTGRKPELVKKNGMTTKKRSGICSKKKQNCRQP